MRPNNGVDDSHRQPTRQTEEGGAVRSFLVLAGVLVPVILGVLWLVDRIEERSAHAVEIHAAHPHNGAATKTDTEALANAHAKDMQRLEKRFDKQDDKLDKILDEVRK